MQIRRPHPFLILLALGLLGAPLAWVSADERDGRLPDGPTWGRGRFRPEASNVLFATADGCALCHSAAPQAAALRTATGEDVSPYGTWRATMMANAFRDPYWRAQVSREVAAAPEKKAAIEALCLRCHGPMVHHTARIAGEAQPSIADASKQALARDGVSCTVCHQVQPDGLGTPERMDGNLDIRAGRTIFGPYPEPLAGPMRMHSAYTPTQGSHLRSSAMCGACHTLTTTPHEGHPGFIEQSPYLEWRNSEFSTEAPGGRTETSRSCQECHMANVGTMRIARNPPGRDFFMEPRTNVRAHVLVGGNTQMLRLLAANRDELEVGATEAALKKMEYATRHFLRKRTAAIEISEITRKDDRLQFDVKTLNLSGHKLPTGYPSRRAWLQVQVRAGRRALFSVGDYDDDGRITALKDPRATTHVDTVRSRSDVVIYETLPLDADGKPTTRLHAMAGVGKDTRLLPRGWKKDGPHAAQLKPIGTESDSNFVAGSDTVHFDVPLPEDAPDGLLVVVWLRYQSIPPAWVDPLRSVDTPEARLFLRLYDDDVLEPESLALQVRREGE